MTKSFEGLLRSRKQRKSMNDWSLRPEGEDIFEKLNNAKNIDKLDSLRFESLKEMLSKDEAHFYKVQKYFVKIKNNLLRI